MHEARAGETERLAGQALEARPQRQMLALDLLHRQLAYRRLRGQEMASIDTGFVRVITRDAQGAEQSIEFQELRILSGTHHGSVIDLDFMDYTDRPNS